MKIKHEKGQGLTEYVLILVLVAIVVITVLQLLGPTMSNFFTTLETSIPIAVNQEPFFIPYWVLGLAALITIALSIPASYLEQSLLNRPNTEYFEEKDPPKKNEIGQGIVEYALILVLLAIIIIAVLMLLEPYLTPIVNLLAAWDWGTTIVSIAVIGGAVYILWLSLASLRKLRKPQTKKEYPPEDRQ